MSLLNPEECLAALVQIRDAAQQRVFISSACSPPTEHFIELLCENIRDVAKDLALARVLVETALYSASVVNTPRAWGLATRATGEVLWVGRQFQEAQPQFEKAVDFFQQASDSLEAGHTLVTMVDNLSRLGRYDEAVREASAEMITLMVYDYLGLVLEATEGSGMHDPVAVPLKIAASVCRFFDNAAAARGRGRYGIRGEVKHEHTGLLCEPRIGNARMLFAPSLCLQRHEGSSAEYA